MYQIIKFDIQFRKEIIDSLKGLIKKSVKLIIFKKITLFI
jgi:hypothetical protein